MVDSVARTGRLLVVDGNYRRFGLSGEVAVVAQEAGLQSRYRRVCANETIPYTRRLESQVMSNTARILDAALELCGPRPA